VSRLRLARAGAQWLHRPRAARAGDVVRQLLAVQAQDLRASRLALRARGAGHGGGAEEVLRTWLCRGTLHLVAADDWPWLLALTAPPRFAANARRLRQLGVSPEDAARAVALLGDEGPLDRATLAERTRLPAQALHHLLHLAALRGDVVMHGDRFVRVEPPPPVDRDAALAELARRYLRGHGPASAADLARWAGLPLRDARAGLHAIARELTVDGDLADLRDRAAVPDRIGPRLLGAYDPYLLGWKDRSFAVPAALAKRVHPGGGLIRATATIDGLVVGTWSTRGLDVPDPALFAGELAALRG
jgi:Winged helix DNA-binding domain